MMKRLNNQSFTFADYTRLRRLIASFMAGSTSTSDESEIYTFYTSAAPGTLPADLERYRAMFAWYGSLPHATGEARPHKRHFVLWASIAASIVLLLTAGAAVFFHRPPQDIPDAACTYSNSYTIRNGERNNNIEEIYDEITSAEAMADSMLRQHADTTYTRQQRRR